MRVPCVVTDIPGCREAVEHNRNGLVPQGHPGSCQRHHRTAHRQRKSRAHEQIRSPYRAGTLRRAVGFFESKSGVRPLVTGKRLACPNPSTGSMKVAFFTNALSHKGGGVFQSVYPLAQSVCRAGHDVAVFAPADSRICGASGYGTLSRYLGIRFCFRSGRERR